MGALLDAPQAKARSSPDAPLYPSGHAIHCHFPVVRTALTVFSVYKTFMAAKALRNFSAAALELPFRSAILRTLLARRPSLLVLSCSTACAASPLPAVSHANEPA
eukprot:6195754-Pleurochrysis_carterae.AAC.1